MSDDMFVVPVLPAKKKEDEKFMELNFLQKRGYLRGCDCTRQRGLNYTNPFFGNVAYKMEHGSRKFYASNYIEQSEAFKMHRVSLRSFKAAINVLKPPIYASEWIKTTENSVGCVYSTILKLRSGYVDHDYTFDQLITKPGKTLLQMTITDYQQFDTMYFCHRLKADSLSFNSLYSVEIGDSTVKIGNEVLSLINYDSRRKRFRNEHYEDHEDEDDIYITY